MDWFSQAKYGLFVHFGLYSLLGGRWQGEDAPWLSEWIMHTKAIPFERYQKLMDDFDPQAFDARALCRFAKQAGFRYLCLTTKHHEGFALFDSQVSTYTSMHAKAKRDLVRELSSACAEFGLVFCVYYSQAQDWSDPNAYEAYRNTSPQNFERYFETKCLPQVKELLTQYGRIGMIWFDTPMGMSFEQCLRLKNLVKELQPECLISGRIGHGLGDFRETGDNMLPALPQTQVFELPATLNESWGYKISDQAYRSEKSVLDELFAVLSRGGNYLLNVGPMGTGEVPEASLKILENVGQYLKKHGEAIYGCEATPVYPYVQDDFYMTQRPGRIYIYLRRRQKSEQLALFNLENKPLAARLLATGEPLELIDGEDLEGHSYWRIKLPESCIDRSGRSGQDERDQVKAGTDVGADLDQEILPIIAVDIEGDELKIEAF